MARNAKRRGISLDPERVVDAALALAEREGSGAVTMRRLGEEMGADPTAVYRHFRSKSDLVAAMADRMFRAAAGEFRLGDDWRANLRAIIVSEWRLYRNHPGFAEALARQPDDSPALASAADMVVRQLRRAGLSDRDAAWTYHVLIDLIAGTGVFYSIAPALAQSSTRAALRRSFKALAPETHPDAVAVAQHLFPDVDDVFHFAVDLVLDAIELRAAGGLRLGRKSRSAGGRAAYEG